MVTRPRPVILLPGAVLPAGPAYAALLEILGDAVDAKAKDLELYEGDTPPPGYSLATEVEGIARVADSAGFECFHLVGYSAGGAASLAFAVAHPDRLLSLALMEPAFAGWGRMALEERAHFGRFATLGDLDGDELMARFRELQLAPGVAAATPPPAPQPPWMAKRPSGIRTLLASFFATDLDLDRLARLDCPVLLVVGDRSHPDYYARMANRLEKVLPDVTVEWFAERHHFDPPHRTEPARLATSLARLWERSEHA